MIDAKPLMNLFIYFFLFFLFTFEITQDTTEPNLVANTDTCDTGSTQLSQVEQTAVVHNVRVSVI